MPDAHRRSGSSGTRRRPPALLLSIGPRLIRFDVDSDAGTLVERDEIALPENVQYAWPHASGDFVYVATSNGGPGGVGNNRHHVSAIRLDPATGALASHGTARALASRAVHLTCDGASRHVLIAHSKPAGLTVYRIEADGTLGDVVDPAVPLPLGIYPHQVRIDPSDTAAVVVTRGHDAAADRAEEPGALNVFTYSDGMLRPRSNIAPGGGFGPRHLDFHPREPWVYVSVERQNKLDMFALTADGQWPPLPTFRKEVLEDPLDIRHRQMPGPIHVHPNGRHLYLANRALGTTEFQGRQVSVGGETAIAVFRLDPETGEPTKVQDMDTRGGHPRTFALDPTARLLVAANSTPLVTRRGDCVDTVAANLALFRVGDDGRLAFLRTYDFPHAERDMLWMGIIG